MYNILEFTRNRSTSVEQTDDKTLRSYCHLNDTIMEAYVEIAVTIPDLEIISVQGDVLRPRKKEFKESFEFLKRVIGTRIGPGILKIVNGLTEGIRHKQFAFMLEECCHAVILLFTKEDLLSSPRPDDEEESIIYHRQMVLDNIRLYNRCAAFAPGSRIVEGITPKDKDI